MHCSIRPWADVVKTVVSQERVKTHPLIPHEEWVIYSRLVNEAFPSHLIFPGALFSHCTLFHWLSFSMLTMGLGLDKQAHFLVMKTSILCRGMPQISVLSGLRLKDHELSKINGCQAASDSNASNVCVCVCTPQGIKIYRIKPKSKDTWITSLLSMFHIKAHKHRAVSSVVLHAGYLIDNGPWIVDCEWRMRENDSLWGRREWSRDGGMTHCCVSWVLFTASNISDLMISIQQEQKWFKSRISFTIMHELQYKIWYKSWRIGLHTA